MRLKLKIKKEQLLYPLKKLTDILKQNRKIVNQESNPGIEMSSILSDKYEGTTEFWFKPSDDITISRVEVSFLSFSDEISGDGISIFNKSKWYFLASYEGVKQDQKWCFQFYGKSGIGSDYCVDCICVI